MRISNWSSDVCSSDLVALVDGDALGGGFELALACQTIVAESGVQMGFPEVLFGLFPGMGAYSLLSQRGSPKVAEPMKIGRASCRDRVCQYVSLSVVAVSLKKNTNRSRSNTSSLYII